MGWGTAQGPLEKLTYARARPLVHDINQLTRSADRLDVLVGMSNGEVVLHNPFSGRNARFNKAVRAGGKRAGAGDGAGPGAGAGAGAGVGRGRGLGAGVGAFVVTSD